MIKELIRVGPDFVHTANPSASRASFQSIQREIQLEHIDARFADEPQKTTLRMTRNQRGNRVALQATCTCDAPRLVSRCGETDIGIHPAAGGGHEIDRHRRGVRRIRRMQRFDSKLVRCARRFS